MTSGDGDDALDGACHFHLFAERSQCSTSIE